ncbi:hypothetical protein Agub_g4695 [Astrephomene gubernaculifera]|uniref:Uncharacterized protein n=1 Tax=Astrephomene gubernaculifera TaxID=47775 RepID=A0AAD3DN22_9CHLO|nr:hypothetical protein Agub_g4695 [Astrephomene gubernaculifera]
MLPAGLDDFMSHVLSQIASSNGFDIRFPGHGDDGENDGSGDDDVAPLARHSPLGPQDEDSFRHFLAQLRDPATSAPTKVALMHRLLADLRAATARQPPRALLAVPGAVAQLCALVTSDWPRRGDLAASAADVDLVVALRPPPPPTGNAGGSGSNARRRQAAAAAAAAPRITRLPHHSLRRVTTAVLTELARWLDSVNAMWDALFFQHLPTILADLAERYKYGQTYGRMYGRGQRTDQGQYMYERLLTLCSESAAESTVVRHFVANKLFDVVVQRYPRLDVRNARRSAWPRLRPRPMDDDCCPYSACSWPARPGPQCDSEGVTAWFESQLDSDSGSEAAGREDEEAEAEAEEGGAGGAVSWLGRRAVNAGAGAEVPQLAAPDVPPSRLLGVPPGMEGMFGADVEPGPDSRDPLPTAFLRFLSCSWPSLPAEARLRPLQRGLLAALTAFPADTSSRQLLEGPLMYRMREAYHGAVLHQFAALRSADARLRDRAARLRLAGNQAFKAGQLEAALQCYTQAVALDWDEPVHRNNRCFTLTKLGRLAEARAEGLHSLACDPRNARSWSRLAAVFEALKQPQAAQLCYRQSLSLLAPRGDEELEGRVRGVELQLKVPRPGGNGGGVASVRARRRGGAPEPGVPQPAADRRHLLRGLRRHCDAAAAVGGGVCG